ncbi:MMPL family transporter [Microvirga sp. 2TAF3]|uniref:hopanoid transporter HpnN n=1 Tax=Microvirga sp. 2TAF3 TaxID=3233014 RepID=UPI003F96A8C7
MPKLSVERVVALCVRRSRLVIAIAVALSLLGLFVAAKLFAINTDTARLISSSAAWRQDEIAIDAAFPQRTDLIVAVVDGETPEIASEAAEKLTAALSQHSEAFRSVRWPDGSPFFAKNGFLLLPTEEVIRTTETLIAQQGLLGPLAADPSLRGVMQTLSLGLQGVRAGQTKLDDLARPMTALSDVLERVLAGRRARLSWQTLLLSGGKAEPRELRRLVLIQPKLDYNALQPGAEVTNLVRRTIGDLGLTPDHGVRIRLTGPVPVADEEFGTLAENVTLNTALTLAAIGLILYLALRSGRIIFAVLATLLAGLIITTGTGLLVVGEFNLISVAFAALFVGLGVDFGIQFAMRYRSERYARDNLPGAIVIAARGVGSSLTLAAISLLAGFFSFLPTEFQGVSELGLIAGLGMVIAYIASLTLLPALIVALRPPGEPESVETASLAAVDRWILLHRRLIIVATVLVVTAGLPFLISIQFDSNPMNLRNKRMESVATFLDLARDPETSPNSIDALAPSLQDAKTLAAKLDALPEVARTMTLANFIPDDQDEKLGIIRDAALLLDTVLHPIQVAAPPTDADNIAALGTTAAMLRDAAESRAGASEDAARHLAAVLDRLAAASPRERTTAEAAVTMDLTRLFDRIRLLMSAERITRENLPPDLVADWIAPDGRARIEVFPKGDANDNAVLVRFADAVHAVAPHASGAPIAIVESGRMVVRAFIEAGLLALAAIFLILAVALRRLLDVALTLGPLVIAAIVTLEAASLLGLPLNFANIIALPLMLAVGVAFHIYYVIAWQAGVVDVLSSSLTRAIFFSALTTGAAFGSLCFSSHPGTASMGMLLALSLFFTLLAAFIVVPAFLGPPRESYQAAVSGGPPDSPP